MIRWLRRRWRAARNRPQGAPAWQRNTAGAIPITPKAERRRKLGTARMAANHWSAKLERALVAGFLSALTLLAVVFCATVAAAFLWGWYEGKSTGQVVLQAILTATAVVVWLNLTHQHYHRSTRKAIANERDVQLRGADQEERRGRGPGLGGPPAPDPTPTTQLPPADAITTAWPPARDERTNFEREFDQQNDWDKPVG